jgi:hypothetical protein
MGRQSFLLLLACLWAMGFAYFSAHAHAGPAPPAGSQADTTHFSTLSAQAIIQLGQAAEMGGDSARLAALDLACQSALAAWRERGPSAASHDFMTQILGVGDRLGALAQQSLHGVQDNFEQSLCARARGDTAVGLGGKDGVVDGLASALTRIGIEEVRGTGLPFLSRLEVEMTGRRQGLIGGITSIEPFGENILYDRHFLMSQVGWHAARDDVNDLGFRRAYDAFNAGLVWRYLTEDETTLYGLNTFLDYAPAGGHWRGSIGAEVKTSQLDVTANRYIPLSDWQVLNDYYEERAAAGYDLELRGRHPAWPRTAMTMRGYQWDEAGGEVYGLEAGLEYQPVQAVTARIAVRDESQESASLEASMRMKWRFDQDDAFDETPVHGLASVRSRIYERAERENTIRVTQRRRASSQLTVLETTGANTAQMATGTVSLLVGQTLAMPVTVTVANTALAFARLRFADGSLLSMGQDSQVIISPALITLVTGTVQYTSNGAITTLNVLGATSNGVNSFVRVRDGQVVATGAVSGSVTLNPTDMAQSIGGVLTSVAFGAGPYVTHGDQVCVRIDRVGQAIELGAAAPYATHPPRITLENLEVGQVITFGLRFNRPVNVTGAPRLTLTINALARNAAFASGSGSNDLMFTYTIQAGDVGATSLVVTGLDLNGGTITAGGQTAVSTIADQSLTLSAAINTGSTDVTPPSGYSVAFNPPSVNAANVTAGGLTIAGAEIGASYQYSVTSSMGGVPVTGSGVVAAAGFSLSGLNWSGLNDGTLTASLTLTDPATNTGAAATSTAVKDVAAPTIVTVTAPANGTYRP